MLEMWANWSILELGNRQSAWSLAFQQVSVGVSLLHSISFTVVVAIVDLQLCPKENCCRPGKPVATGGQVRQQVWDCKPRLLGVLWRSGYGLGRPPSF